MSASIFNTSSRTRHLIAVPIILTAFLAACDDAATPTAPVAGAPAPSFAASGSGGNSCSPRCGAPILFDRFVNGGLTHYVGKMDANGSNVTLLHLGSNPAWGPGYKKIAFNYIGQFGAQEIWTMNADGSGAGQITNVAGSNDRPSWSPDGTKIAFVSYRNGPNGQIFTMDASGSNQKAITTDSSSADFPSWSPDGTKILFTSYRTGNADVFVMNTDGTNVQQLTTDPAGDGSAVWSPDGKQIAYVHAAAGCDIFIMNADGSAKKQVVNGLDDCETPTWSPTGTKLAFVSELIFGQSYAIFTMNVDGSNVTKINLGRQMDLLPAWSRK
jgi:TolB protein